MKRQKIGIIVFYTFAALVAAAVIGLMIYEFAVTKEGNSDTAVRGGLILAALGLSVARVLTRSRGAVSCKSLSLYREQYGDFIGNAFESDRKRENKLCSALNDYQSGDIRGAIKKLDALLPSCKKKSESFAVRFFLARCYDSAGVHYTAIKYYESLLELRAAPRATSRVLSNLASCYEAIGDTEGAEARYRQAIEAYPENPYPYNNMAHLFIRQGKYPEALEFSLKVSELDPNIYQAYSAQAIAHAMLGDSEASRAALDRLVLCGGDAAGVREMIQQLKENEEAK